MDELAFGLKDTTGKQQKRWRNCALGGRCSSDVIGLLVVGVAERIEGLGPGCVTMQWEVVSLQVKKIMGTVCVSAALQDVLTVNAESDWLREMQMRNMI